MTVEWHMRVTAPCKWLTANDRRTPIAQSALIRQWREASFAAAKVAHLPVGLQRVRIDVVAHFRGRPPVRDRSNLAPTIKAVVDGLGPARDFLWRGKPFHAVGYGLIPDDSDAYLDGPHLEIGAPLPARTYAAVGELELFISDLSAGVLAAVKR